MMLGDANKTASVEFIDAAGAPGQANGAADSNVPLFTTETTDIRSFSSIIGSDETLVSKARALVLASRQHVAHQFASVRPWREFFDRDYFAVPDGASDAMVRLGRNTRHFYPNYVIVSLLCSSYILIINLAFSLCVLFVVFAYFYIKSKAADLAARGDVNGTIYVFNRGFSAMQLYIMLSVFAVLSFYFTNGSSVAFWLALATIGVSGTHAVMRRPPVEQSNFAFA